MKIIQIDLNKDYSEAIREAVAVLGAGGVIVYPTDTIYGIGANALNEKAVSRVFEIKKRPLAKPLPMIIRDISWAKELAEVKKKDEKVLEKVWPGKVTVVLNKKEIVPDILTSGHKTVGMRVANYPMIDELLKLFGYPITSTSANISGEEGSGDINKVLESFPMSFIRQPDLVLDVGILPKSQPSAILDLTGDKPKISRVGPSRPEELLKLLNI
jgi:L-threonylcarbamoyladenylate synthase